MTRAKGAEVFFGHSTINQGISEECLHVIAASFEGLRRYPVALTRTDEAAEFISDPAAGK